jgi:hypothetical protein
MVSGGEGAGEKGLDFLFHGGERCVRARGVVVEHGEARDAGCLRQL